MVGQKGHERVRWAGLADAKLMPHELTQGDMSSTRVEIRAAEHRHDLSEKQRLAEERQKAWEEAMEKARTRYAERRRIDALLLKVEAWQRAEAIHAYCDALESTGRGMSEAVEWARSYADELSSNRVPLVLPESTAPASLEELRPFLDGWSPYGPDSR